MNLNIIKIAEETKNILASPDQHCVRFNACDVEGHPVDIRDPAACKYCFYGASLLAQYRLGLFSSAYYDASYEASKRLGCSDLISLVNDNPAQGYPVIMQILDEIISFEKSQA